MERLIDEHGLDDVGEELQRRYSGPESERSSLRELADLFNKALLERSFDEAAVPTTNFDVENIYEQLYHADAPPGELARVRKRLRYAGVAVDRVEGEFISHEAIRTYLRRQGVVYSEPERDQIDKYAEDIQRLRYRTVTVTEDKLQSLESTGRITLGEFRVDVDVQVHCETCGTEREVSDVLSARGCACRE